MDANLIIARVPGSPRLWLMLMAACLLAYGFFEIVDDVFSDPLEGDMESHEFDEAVFRFFMQFRSDGLTQIAIDLTALGSVSVLAVCVLLVFAVIIGIGDVAGFLHMSVASMGALVWPLVLKPYFGRDRPDLIEPLVQVADLSFPSGHAFGAAAIYVSIAFLCSRFVRKHSTELLCYLFALVLVAVVGTTRIYLGVHYATDVLAGVTAGGAWAFCVAAGYPLLCRRAVHLR